MCVIFHKQDDRYKIANKIYTSTKTDYSNHSIKTKTASSWMKRDSQYCLIVSESLSGCWFKHGSEAEAAGTGGQMMPGGLLARQRLPQLKNSTFSEHTDE